MVMIRFQKGGIVIAKSIFSQKYEIYFDNSQSRTDLEILRAGGCRVSHGVGSSLSGI